MGKKSRRAKAKTSDFQKVKLKVGKKRPLPTNVTEVAFKSQAVYVPEQLKNVAVVDEATVVGASGGKDVLELLGQVGHFNANFRVDSLTSLRVFFTNNKNEIQHYLPKIIEKVPRTIADEEQQVRKSSIALFKVIFANLGEQEMAPFFDIVLSHLYCAMSHIFDDVQKDSLQVVDLCTEYFPSLLSQQARNSLLQHFIELISTKQTKSAATSGKGSKVNPGVTRVLSMKLSSKESSIVWRNRILKRLDDLLHISTSSDKVSNDSGTWMKYLESYNQENDGSRALDDGAFARWDGKEIGEILTQFNSPKLTLPSFSLSSNPLSTISSVNDGEEAETSPWSLISTLFPLLFDCWHEAAPHESKGLTIESKETMSYVLNIVNVLTERYLRSADDKDEAIENLRCAFMKDFRQYFFESFPFTETSGRQPSAKKKRLNQEPSVNIQEINLSICALVTALASEHSLSEDSEVLSTVASYLSMAIMSDGSKEGSNLDSASLEKCISAIEKLLQIAVDNETRMNLLQPLLLLYQSLNSCRLEKSTLLRFFMKLHSDEKDSDLSSNEVMAEWLCSLPNLLTEVLSNKEGTLCSDSSTTELAQLLLYCFRLGCLRETCDFLSCLGENRTVLLEVLKENVCTLFCSTKWDEKSNTESCSICSSIQARLFEVLIHHTQQQLSKEDVTTLSWICNKPQVTPENVVYVVEMLLQRFQKYGSPDDFVTTMQFICTLLIGISKDDLQSLQPETGFKQSCYETLNMTDTKAFYRHTQIVKKLCEILPTIEQSSTLLQHFICEKLLKQFQSLPALSVYGILKVGKMIFGFPMLNATRMKAWKESLGTLCAKVLLCLCDNESTISCSIRDNLSNASFLLLINKEVLSHCIKGLHDADLEKSKVFESTCRVIQVLTTNSAVCGSLLECQEEIETLLNVMKSNKDHSSDELFQCVEINLSVLFKK